jgi:DNA repair exonuclease SbcCD nuclease subunit
VTQKPKTKRTEIALFTDLHLGIHKDSKMWLELCENSVDFVISTCKSRKIKKIVFGGDWLHNRNFVNVNTLNVAIRCINKLTDAFDEIFFIIGNHDIYLKNSVDIHSLKFLDLLHLHTDKIKLISKTTSWNYCGKDFLFVPWLGQISDDEVLQKKYDIIIGHLDLDVNFFIKEFFIESQQKKVDIAAIESYLKESDLFEYTSTDKISSLNASISVAKNEQKKYINKFSDLCKPGTVVYSGHFHKHELIPHDTWEFLFIGCPLELTWADAYNPKGMYILDVEGGTREFIENSAGPKHLKIYLSKYDVATDYSFVRGNFVKLFVDREPGIDETRAITEHLNSFAPLEPCEIKYEYIKDVSTMSDAAALTAAYSKMKMSKLELMRAYINSIEDAAVDKEVLNKLATAYFSRATA